MIWILLIALLHVVCGAVVANRFWRPASPAELPAAALLTAYLTFYGFPVLLGWTTGWIHTWTILLSAAGAVGLAIFARRKFQPTFRWTELKALNTPVWLGHTLLWLPALLLLTATLWLASRLPVRAWDAASYHIMNPMRWAMTHHFILDAFGDWNVTSTAAQGAVFPNQKGILPFLVLDWTRSVEGTALAQWPFALILAALIPAMFRRLALPAWTAPLGVFFVLSAPEVLHQSTEAYADLVFLTGLVAIVWTSLAVYQDGPLLSRVGPQAIAFSLFLGSKPNAYPIGVILALLVTAAAAWKCPAADRRSRVRCAAITLGLIVGISGITVGPWPLNGLLHGGNPVYPFRLSWGDTEILPGRIAPGVNAGLVELYTGARGWQAWWNMVREVGRSPSLASLDSGLGAHAFVLGIPCLLAFIRALWRGQPLAGARRFTLLLFGVALLLTPAPFLARFVLYLLPVLGLAFCWVTAEADRWSRSALVALLLILGAYNVYRWIPTSLYQMKLPEEVAYALLTGHTTPLRRDQFPGEFDALDYWREHLSRPGTKLAYAPGIEAWMAYRPGGGDMVRVAPPDQKTPPAVWAEELAKQGVTHLYAPRDSAHFAAARKEPKRFQLLMHRIDRGTRSPYPQPVLQDAALYQIRPAATPAGPPEEKR